jgi:peroxiredoxin Q/BCP
MYEEFKDAGAEVVGISADSPEKHAKFIAKHNLPFVLLCDERKEVSKSYGVKGSLFGLLPGRETFVIDEQGVIRHIFRSQFKAEQHVEEAVSIIRGLKS